ncbi:hypothetical protein DL98DRAFT_518167 [Cadophora sp. DSE1049]|nr:hypothetical protein DL98DRAFT_518167 [Cadophora sp. DSE1049]
MPALPIPGPRSCFFVTEARHPAITQVYWPAIVAHFSRVAVKGTIHALHLPVSRDPTSWHGRAEQNTAEQNRAEQNRIFRLLGLKENNTERSSTFDQLTPNPSSNACATAAQLVFQLGHDRPATHWLFMFMWRICSSTALPPRKIAALPIVCYPMRHATRTLGDHVVPHIDFCIALQRQL